jgi:hypothetical protein
MTVEDLEEIDRLLALVFERDPEPVAAAQRWLKDRSEVFRMTPIDMLKRDELGVVWVLSYLKAACP